MASIIKANKLQDFAGNDILSSDGAGVVTVNADGLKNVPAFKATLSADQSIPNSSFTKVTLDTENFDTNNAFASNKFTVPAGHAGKYVFHYGGYMSSLGDDKRLILVLYKNGAEITGPKSQHQIYSTGGSSNVLQKTSFVIDLAVSDYIELYVWQNQGGAVDLYADNTYLAGYKLGA
jgi:hypothetical protein